MFGVASKLKWQHFREHFHKQIYCNTSGTAETSWITILLQEAAQSVPNLRKNAGVLFLLFCRSKSPAPELLCRTEGKLASWIMYGCCIRSCAMQTGMNRFLQLGVWTSSLVKAVTFFSRILWDIHKDQSSPDDVPCFIKKVCLQYIACLSALITNSKISRNFALIPCYHSLLYIF